MRPISEINNDIKLELDKAETTFKVLHYQVEHQIKNTNDVIIDIELHYRTAIKYLKEKNEILRDENNELKQLLEKKKK